MTFLTKRRPGNVSFVRFKLGLSQQQLADTLGLSRSMIAMIETGKRKLSGPVAAIYQAMCEKAATANPNGYCFVKRGRKPARTDLSSVTNYNSNAGKDKAELFIAALEQEKTTLRYRQTGLQFRKKAMEEHYRRFSDRQSYVTAMLEISDKLVVSLPAGKTKDKYELKQAVFYAKQVRLKQHLKKCGAVEQLKVEFQLRVCERMIQMTEEIFTRLNINRRINEDHVMTLVQNSPNLQA